MRVAATGRLPGRGWLAREMPGHPGGGRLRVGIDFLSVTVLRDIVYRDKTFQWKSDIPDAVKETVKADKKFPKFGWFLFMSGRGNGGEK